MDKKYYLIKEDKRFGPFSVEELAEQGLSPDSRVYVLGASSFKNASEIEELQQFLTPVTESDTEDITPKNNNDEINPKENSLEKEILQEILRQLHDLKDENKRLSEELKTLRNNPTPPYFTSIDEAAQPVSPIDEQSAVATSETDNAWKNELVQPPEIPKEPKPSSGSGCANGCITFIIVILILGFASLIFFALTR